MPFLHLHPNRGLRLVDGAYTDQLPEAGQIILFVEDGLLKQIDHEGTVKSFGGIGMDDNAVFFDVVTALQFDANVFSLTLPNEEAPTVAFLSLKDAFYDYLTGLDRYRQLYALTDDRVITNESATLLGTGMGTTQLPMLYSGDVIVVRFAGRIETDDTGTPSIGFRIKFGETEVADFGDFVQDAEASVAVWGEARITVRSAGESGVTSAMTHVLNTVALGDPVSLDLSEALEIDVLLEMADSSAGDTFTCTALTIEVNHTS